jgi:hypothetical protein
MHDVGGWQKPTLGDEQVIRDQKKPPSFVLRMFKPS